MTAIKNLVGKVVSGFVFAENQVTITLKTGGKIIVTPPDNDKNSTKIYRDKLTNVMGEEVDYKHVEGLTITRAHFEQCGKFLNGPGVKATLAIDFGAIDLMIRWQNSDINAETVNISFLEIEE